MSSQSDDELVSVVIPTYFRNDALRGALESVFDQPYEPIETIVVDDSGEGYASETVEAFDDVHYLELDDNRGAHRAREVGIEASTGRYVQLLDDDDRLLDDKLNKQVDVFRERDDVGVVYCGLQWEDGPAVLPDPRVRGDVLEFALQFQTSPAAMGTMLIDRATIERVLPLRHHHGADDIGMKIELARVTEWEFVDEVLLFRGRSDGSVGTSMAAVEGRKRIIDTYADRYDEFPERIRRSALAETHLVEGQFLLREQIWSPAAVRSFALAAYYAPGVQLPYLGSLVASLLGRPGHALSRRLFSRFVLGSERRGKRT